MTAFNRIRGFISAHWRWVKENHEGLQVLMGVVTIGVATWLLLETQRQVKIMRESSRIELRAFLAIVDLPQNLDIYDTLKNGKIETNYEKIRRVDWFIKNLGRTPAYDMRDTAYLVVTDKITEDPHSLRSDPIGSTIIGADIKIPQTTRINKIFPVQRQRLYLCGRIDYRDIFMGDHFLTFCFEYMLLQRSFSTYNLYGRFNDEDHEQVNFGGQQ